MTLPPSEKVREQPYNLMPLEEWRNQMIYNPFHFWQLSNSIVPVSSMTSNVLYKYPYQMADRLARIEIVNALIDVESLMKTQMLYSIAPHYVEEEIRLPLYPDRRFDFFGYAASDARWRTVTLSETHLIDVGVETLLEIEAPAVVYSDMDMDGLNDTATLTFPTTVTDPDQIAVYFSSADRFDGSPAGERWRVAPARVSITGGTATVQLKAWQCVRPILYEGFSAASIDPSVSSNFVTTLEVYQRYTSAGTGWDTCQAVLIWETRPYPQWALAWGYPTSKTDPAGMAYGMARCGVRDKDKGIVTFGESVYDQSTGEWNMNYNFGYWCRPPDRIIVRYRAGYPLEEGRIAAKFRRVVARFAAAQMTRQIAANDTSNRELYDAQFDLSNTMRGGTEAHAIHQNKLMAPWGQRRGQIEAWDFCAINKDVRGVAF
jgi:hypothetical protein